MWTSRVARRLTPAPRAGSHGGMKLLASLLATLFVAATAQAAGAPRAADGHADLTGVWSNGSLTQLQRGPGTPLIAPEAAARQRAAAVANRKAADAKPSDFNDGLLDQRSTAVGVNSFWGDAGDSLGFVKGTWRNSWIVEPADGQMPLSDAGRARARAAPAMSQLLTPAGPEALAPNDRCLISSRGSGGPGMLNNIYNTNYQIVQTPGSVAIVVEMIHDARIVPVFAGRAAAQAGHKPAALRPWLGDSVGWWEGDTLVIETLNVPEAQGTFGPIFLSAKGRVTERLTRASARQILYEFSVEDPVYYTRPWRAEMSLNARKDQIYEYACHEGNYAMRGILGGARAREAEAATTAQ